MGWVHRDSKTVHRDGEAQSCKVVEGEGSATLPARAAVSSTEHTLIDTVIDWEGMMEDGTGQRTVSSEVAPAGRTVDASHLVEMLVRASPTACTAAARGLADAVVDALEDGDVVAARTAARKLLEFVEQHPAVCSPMAARRGA